MNSTLDRQQTQKKWSKNKQIVIKQDQNFKTVKEYLDEHKIDDKKKMIKYNQRAQDILNDKLKAKFGIRHEQKSKSQQQKLKDVVNKTAHQFFDNIDFKKSLNKKDEKQNQKIYDIGNKNDDYIEPKTYYNSLKTSQFQSRYQKKEIKQKGSNYLNYTKESYSAMLMDQNQNKEINNYQKQKLEEYIKSNPVSYKTVAYMKINNHQTRVNLMKQNFILSKKIRQLAVKPFDQQNLKQRCNSQNNQQNLDQTFQETTEFKKIRKQKTTNKYFKHNSSYHNQTLDQLYEENQQQNLMFGQSYKKYQDEKEMAIKQLHDKKSIEYRNELLYVEQVHQLEIEKERSQMKKEEKEKEIDEKTKERSERIRMRRGGRKYIKDSHIQVISTTNENKT